jgi:hypothetical protein
MTLLTMAAVFYSLAAIVAWFLPTIARLPSALLISPILIWFFWSFSRSRRQKEGARRRSRCGQDCGNGRADAGSVPDSGDARVML